jgi:hypothetical protein
VRRRWDENQHLCKAKLLADVDLLPEFRLRLKMGMIVLIVSRYSRTSARYAHLPRASLTNGPKSLRIGPLVSVAFPLKCEREQATA